MRLFGILLLLAACAEGPVSRLNSHTGVASLASGTVTIDRRHPARLDVRMVRLTKGGDEEFALLTFVTRDDRIYPKIAGAWSFGKALPYERIDRRRVGLARQEAGLIRLTRGVVEAAAAGPGLTLQLVGPRGSHTGHVPATLFQETLGPWGTPAKPRRPPGQSPEKARQKVLFRAIGKAELKTALGSIHAFDDSTLSHPRGRSRSG